MFLKLRKIFNKFVVPLCLLVFCTGAVKPLQEFLESLATINTWKWLWTEPGTGTARFLHQRSAASFQPSPYKSHMACFMCSVKKLEDDFQGPTMSSARNCRAAASLTQQTCDQSHPTSWSYLHQSTPERTTTSQPFRNRDTNLNSLIIEDDLFCCPSQNPSWLDCWSQILPQKGNVELILIWSPCFLLY